MSLVGPRPPLAREVEQYEDWHHKRLRGPMGLTGLWQVSGRNELNFEEMALLDLYYLRNATVFHDLRILFKTAVVVLLGRGL
jgi:lipopolysaccharide/colanic/teichoic acid biosynthesis glycosyltransferase